ncbi:phage portal protein [Tepidibacter hydrothermalis]|uniref:Phage portal protein n=1 Tax=Tepidibacter hydrothermalis TaxID=3036126 RepID=A0ABY8EGE1_9FIRM|nr:phage portal protein [Tepidibacter hydrothermalis]WFD12003.1 phage portal protein [Tepidibacter hydrothermalis]
MDISHIINAELGGIYGTAVLKDMQEIINLYNFYDGKGQDWRLPGNLDYKPTKLITNKAKKLIKKEARFMFSRTPEININPYDRKDEDSAKEISQLVNKVLKKNKFPDKLIKAARDCFIGKRVALKLNASDKSIKVMFRPSLEFVYETNPEDIDDLQKIIFFYTQNNDVDKSRQKIWKQKYEMLNGKCILNEGVYDGYGNLVEVTYQDYNTNLDFIPCYVIVNDGLTGDLNGESDVAEIGDNQDNYNKLKSDDVDALKFNMFPQLVIKNGSQKTHESMKVAPGAKIDLQSEDEELDSDAKYIESSFSYDSRFENTINRVNNDMHDVLSIPNVSLEQLKGLMQSGKSMKALYWELIERCEEKWTTWGPALEWMTEKIIELIKIYKPKNLGAINISDIDYSIAIEHLYPILEDEETERLNDIAEVQAQVRSRKSYIEKWNINEDADGELEQIATEQTLLQDAYLKSSNEEINNLEDDINEE